MKTYTWMDGRKYINLGTKIDISIGIDMNMFKQMHGPDFDAITCKSPIRK